MCLYSVNELIPVQEHNVVPLFLRVGFESTISRLIDWRYTNYRRNHILPIEIIFALSQEIDVSNT